MSRGKSKRNEKSATKEAPEVVERLAALQDAEEDAASLTIGSKGFRETFGRLLVQVFHHRGLLLGASALMVLGVAAGLVTPWIFGYAVDHAILPKNRDLLAQLAVVFFFLRSFG